MLVSSLVWQPTTTFSQALNEAGHEELFVLPLLQTLKRSVLVEWAASTDCWSGAIYSAIQLS